MNLKRHTAIACECLSNRNAATNSSRAVPNHLLEWWLTGVLSLDIRSWGSLKKYGSSLKQGQWFFFLFFLDECLCNQTESIFVFTSVREQGWPQGQRDKSGLGDIFLSFFPQLRSPLSFDRTTLPGTMEAELWSNNSWHTGGE